MYPYSMLACELQSHVEYGCGSSRADRFHSMPVVAHVDAQRHRHRSSAAIACAVDRSSRAPHALEWLDINRCTRFRSTIKAYDAECMLFSPCLVQSTDD
jgi:hypothetical protein